MEIDQLSAKQINELEQHTAQLLKMMRRAKLSHLPIYSDLQALEHQFAQARLKRFDQNNSEYPGY